jgi:hypothetical protein
MNINDVSESQSTSMYTAFAITWVRVYSEISILYYSESRTIFCVYLLCVTAAHGTQQ